MVPLPECLYIAESLQDESDRGLICCLGKFFKPLDNIRRFALELLPDEVSLIF